MQTPQQNHEEDGFEGEPLAKSRTLPDMVGAFPAKSLVLALSPMFLSLVLHGAGWPYLLLPVTFAAAYFITLWDLYLFEIFFAAISAKPSPNKHLWGVKRYVPR